MTKKAKTNLKIVLMLIVSAGIILYSIGILPTEVFIKKGETPAFNMGLPVTTLGDSYKNTAAQEGDNISKYKTNYFLFGTVPVKEVSITVTDDIRLIPGGIPFGIKFYTQGVLVVGMSEFETAKGKLNPAYNAGIRTKDIILSIDGEVMKTNEDVSNIVEQSNGKTLVFKIKREKAVYDIKVTPVLSKEEKVYRIGLWVRDSTAGIGTVTYINPENKNFAGLGHGICDIDTGDIMPLSEGVVIGAYITDVKKGFKGRPGELLGSFMNGETFGILNSNTEQGVFGKFTIEIPDEINKPLPVSYKQNIKEGPAEIICCIDGNTPQTYKINIERVYKTGDSKAKNMVIKITDKKLLEKTGGIVQGMSGSPIIQGGHLIGAVTHVLVNDPTRGFGIFIENMLKHEVSFKNAA